LQQGPAELDALVAFVHTEYDADAYSDIRDKAGRKRLENDIARLRGWGVEIHYIDGAYHLIGYGDFSLVALGEVELDSLAFLQETFTPGVPNAEAIQQLLQTILDWLPAEQRRSLTGRRQRLRVDLQRRDNDVIAPEVEEAIERALAQRRLLRFDYLSPNQADGIPRRHTVQPWSLYFDTTHRHLYLDAYRVALEGPFGLVNYTHWHAYRLGRILARNIEVLPDKFPSIPPKRPRYALEYLLAPEIARLGEISRHFDEMEIHVANEAGWVRVTATTTDLFGAVRKLLSYGPMCKVAGGPEARHEMETLVRAMGEMYGDSK
jgi:predicted DNA-binding transcriptional regulator YafY